MEQLKTIEAWERVRQQSMEQPVLILKYSLTCFASISAMKMYKAMKTPLPKYVVVVQTGRAVSNAIAEDLHVRHESPQLLILKDGRGIWQATHYHIKEKLVQEAIEQYT